MDIAMHCNLQRDAVLAETPLPSLKLVNLLVVSDTVYTANILIHAVTLTSDLEHLQCIAWGPFTSLPDLSEIELIYCDFSIWPYDLEHVSRDTG